VCEFIMVLPFRLSTQKKNEIKVISIFKFGS